MTGAHEVPPLPLRPTLLRLNCHSFNRSTAVATTDMAIRITTNGPPAWSRFSVWAGREPPKPKLVALLPVLAISKRFRKLASAAVHHEKTQSCRGLAQRRRLPLDRREQGSPRVFRKLNDLTQNGRRFR